VDIRIRLSESWEQEEQYWFQWSRINWLLWGYRNSKFFHASMVQRRDRNTILRIKEHEGVCQEGPNAILNSIVRSFATTFTASITEHQETVLASVPNLVTDEENRELMREVTLEDVRVAVFALGATKAPGPDGLNGQFYKRHWETIKADVCQAIQEFFAEGTLPSVINETLVALTPKVALPEAIGQLKTISCFNAYPSHSSLRNGCYQIP